LGPEYTVAAEQIAKTKMNVPTISNRYLLFDPVATVPIKYYSQKWDTQIVLIKEVNATDMMEETGVEAKLEEIMPKLFWYQYTVFHITDSIYPYFAILYGLAPK
jgi:hypothetical protein